jgi:acyl dehydratase
MLRGEERFALANEMVQWTISSDERREFGRAAGPWPAMCGALAQESTAVACRELGRYYKGAMDALYLEDFAVGQRFVSATHRLDAEQIKAFAARFDPQPFHTDEAAAKDSFFGGLAASGWHTASITMSLLVKSGMPIAGGLIGAGCEISWPRPTRPGDVLTVESEVLAVAPSRSRPDRGMITLKSETKNQKGETVQMLTSKMLVWKRP